jgi:hypothetical protein
MVSSDINKRIASLEAAQKPTAHDPRRVVRLMRGEDLPDATEDERSRAARLRELLTIAEKH